MTLRLLLIASGALNLALGYMLCRLLGATECSAAARRQDNGVAWILHRDDAQ